jgi:hypothetical protein
VASPIVPLAGHAYLDFQLTMALSYLHKSLAAGGSVPEHA